MSERFALPPGLSPHERTFYQQLSKRPFVYANKVEEITENVPVDMITDVINSLSRKGLLAIEVMGKENVFKAVKVEEASKTAGMDPDVKLVYQTIKNAENEGIWLKHIKTKTNLHQQVVIRCVKQLEQRQLVKAVKNVKFPTRKTYMLFELTPSVELTGGAWYTDQTLDEQFIKAIMDVCHRYIADKSYPRKAGAVYPPTYSHYPSADQIRRHIKDSGVSGIELSLQDIKSILDVLIYDGKVEKFISMGYGDDDDDDGYGSSSWVYKAVRAPQKDHSLSEGLAEIPCGTCPVFDFCSEDGPVSPNNCEYYKQWLKKEDW
ncbi:hypothetical protein BZG36_04965 [Bifiguratus adelaidae]|uniref:DNA-directed RNA polymerase III subunit RPC6 n=1 Tax=Bifiguratus adelaidae TaxID=1938954 RepID=A0A261XUM3_9FUNG|nr:hypothetical protein BZG36_04965 [Bifiguratus adelaidae]